MSHPFDRYFRRHQHYPRLIISNGVQRLTAEFSPGYVHIRTSPPYSGSVYLTRTAWIQLLQRSIPLTRKWEAHPDHDVPQAMHDSYLWEKELLQEKREIKRRRR